ncbi:MAG: hypothetical protein ABSD38_08785 [Syntrophorhabdales bacterium]|jgi:hypothetical protein
MKNNTQEMAWGFVMECGYAVRDKPPPGSRDGDLLPLPSPAVLIRSAGTFMPSSWRASWLWARS